MIDGEGRLRVLDFGLAKLHDPAGPKRDGTQAPTATVETEEGKILGTVAYMSPEQAEGKAVDPRSDVFSLGTILYEMATGERPFRGDTNMSTIGSILRDEPAPVTELNRSLPRHLGRIIRRCLAKDPDRRYQTALDLRNELEELKAEIDSGELCRPGVAAAARQRRCCPLARSSAAVAALIVVAGIMLIEVEADRNPGQPFTCRGRSPVRSARRRTSTGRPSGSSSPIGLTRGERRRHGSTGRGRRGGRFARAARATDHAALVAGRKVPRLRLELRDRVLRCCSFRPMAALRES